MIETYIITLNSVKYMPRQITFHKGGMSTLHSHFVRENDFYILRIFSPHNTFVGARTAALTSLVREAAHHFGQGRSGCRWSC